MIHFLSFVWEPPTGINLGFFTIQYYSLMFVIAFALGWWIMKKIYIRENIPLEKLDTIFIYTVFATLIGARLGHVFFYDWAYYKDHLLEIILPFRVSPYFEFTGFRGLASHGAAIGIIIAMYYYSKKVIQKPLLWVLDRIVLPVSCGGIFIRIGNFFNSEIYGKPTTSELGVIFAANGENFARYPTQLIESFCYLIVFLILMWVYWKTEKRLKQGYMFGLFLVLLWSVRFVVEFWKENQVEFENTMSLNMGQILSIPFILFGLYLLFRPKKQTIS